MDFTTIQIGIEKNVARVALNRPECHNAFNQLMISESTLSNTVSAERSRL